MDDRIYLFFGYSSEYVLNPLYTEMCKMGYRCVEIEMSSHKDIRSTVKSIKGQEIVLITSAHLFYDAHNFEKTFNYRHSEWTHCLELIEFLNPIKKVYYPHDLTSPLTEWDVDYISLFDLFLSPLPYLDHFNRYLRTVEVGWIKKRSLSVNTGNKNQLTHLFSNINFFERMDFKDFYKYWAPLYDLGVGVKLPKWQSSNVLEQKLHSCGVRIVPSSSNIFEIIENSSVVVTNGTSSVNIEAALCGKHVVNIWDGVSSLQEHRKSFNGLPQIKILPFLDAVSYIREIKNAQEELDKFEDILKPFDFINAVAQIVR
ncbi:hypothetical protein ACFQ3J_18330 [Paenibacillus provencensis]|uniref:Uncharacterized protein n=1 Tax=Paenibacillus provencensis TaxID=441151 RepID=A0ABW3PYI1_9BACL|nr:hypothetical protein [Paenibacillus sp. MER 78]MCM3128280.1 hypothetical protein [Paenibacillus sp. MER 78]